MIAIVKSSFNSKVTDGLYKGCVAALNQNGFSEGKIETKLKDCKWKCIYILWINPYAKWICYSRF